MLAGSIPVKRFSPSSLSGHYHCETEAAQTDRAWVTHKLAMDGIEKTKAGNRPVSAFRAKFLRDHALQTPCSGTTETLACARAVLRLLRSLGTLW
jgi:hypothetical protein